jgi:hypothetical protein
LFSKTQFLVESTSHLQSINYKRFVHLRVQLKFTSWMMGITSPLHYMLIGDLITSWGERSCLSIWTEKMMVRVIFKVSVTTVFPSKSNESWGSLSKVSPKKNKHRLIRKFKPPLDQMSYPSSRCSKCASCDRFLSLNYFLKWGDKVLHCMVTRLLSNS